jgi:D-3-phosphoglycerate dehydrogenase
VLYADLTGLDVGSGQEVLRDRGLDVLRIAGDPGQDDLDRVVALMAGYDRVDDALLGRLPGLRLVATHSAGVDMVDLGAVRRRGLWLCNVPYAATEEVASHALAMALALLRRLPEYDRQARSGGWSQVGAVLPRLPTELTLGVLGMGRIGSATARFGMGVFRRVLGHDPGVEDAAWPAGVTRVEDVDELCRRSDVLSLHLPLTDRTRRIVDARRLALLPPGAVLVNVSRGGLVDEAALVDALHAGRIAGAGCDVLAAEPPDAADPLLSAPGVLLSPHVAYLSERSLRRYVEVPVRNVLALLETGEPLTPVLSPPPASTSP